MNKKEEKYTYTSWRKMRERCTGRHSHHDPHYRHVTCDPSWNRFPNFFRDMGRRPKGTSLDRIKGGSSNYTKSNCRWATPSQQCRNLSRNVNITIGDQTKCITDWCAHFNIGRSTVYARIKRGFSPLDALVLPVRRYRYRGILVEIDGVVKGTMEWARHYGLKGKTVNKRLSRGWDRVRAVSTPVKISK